MNEKKKNFPDLPVTQITSATGASFSINSQEALKRNWDVLYKIAKPILDAEGNSEETSEEEDSSKKNARVRPRLNDF